MLNIINLQISRVKEALIPLTYFIYLGSRFICSCCGGHFRKFLPFGVTPRPNAQCPRCGSLERHRLLLLYLKDKTNFFTDSLKVLDIAPMEWFQRKCLSLRNLDYVSIDISSPLATTQMDITNMYFEKDTFDCIICFHVLEHIVDDRTALKEIFRVLKPNGWAILQVPIFGEKTFEDPDAKMPEERLKVFGQRDHVRIYGRDYKERLESAGFSVKVDSYVRELRDDLIKRYCLMKDEDIYFCTKRS